MRPKRYGMAIARRLTTLLLPLAVIASGFIALTPTIASADAGNPILGTITGKRVVPQGMAG